MHVIMKAMLACGVLALAGACSTVPPSARTREQPVARLAYTGIVAFGDSLTDNGNRGIDTNRNSTVYPRETWIRQLAGPTMLNVPDFKASGRKTFAGGTNYAYGGATTKFTASLKVGDAQSRNLTNQISGRYLNPAFNTAGVQKGALHVVQIGGNDVVFAAASWPRVASGWITLDGLARKAARSAETQVQALAAAGVTNVLWLNVANPARFPAVQLHSRRARVMRPLVLRALSRAARAFNDEVDAAILRLEAAHPSLVIVRVDMDRIVDAFLDHPERYGLVNVTEGKNSDGYLFSADGLHPTTHGHHLLARQIYELITAKPAR